jgi:endonuclease-3 related protein
MKKTEVLLDIYNRLLKKYGPQHWWPGETPFEVMVGAILTQSAAWTNVEKAINNLKKANVLSPRVIRDLPVDKLVQLIRPCGYYNAKARKLKTLVSWLGRHYSDDLDRLFALDIETLREQLLSLQGVGEETADSIILYAGGKPVFVIDAYTRRIIGRIGLLSGTDSYDTFRRFFMNNLTADTGLFNEYHALLVALAKDACRKQPLCDRCCLINICGDYLSGAEHNH